MKPSAGLRSLITRDRVLPVNGFDECSDEVKMKKYSEKLLTALIRQTFRKEDVIEVLNAL